MNFISQLENAFHEKSNSQNAFAMSKYSRNLFNYFGIKTEERRAVFKAICLENQLEISRNHRAIALELYAKDEREYHYCAIEILIKNLKRNYKKEDIHLIEKILTTHSWWDSVDTIAKNILGEYLLTFPSETIRVIEQFSNSDNMWLNRSAIIFQLGYKQKTNFEILKSECLKHKNSSQFFIKKAIGWALREYAKTSPESVKKFVISAQLKPLSTKEALKNIG